MQTGARENLDGRAKPGVRAAVLFLFGKYEEYIKAAVCDIFKDCKAVLPIYIQIGFKDR